MKDMDWDNMRKNLEALYVLDNALTDPSEEYLRLINKKEIDSNLKYEIDNGAGDLLSVIFTETAVLIKGFAHENSLNQFASDEWNQSIIDRMYEGLDEKWKNLFSVEERGQTTFFIWYDGEVHHNIKWMEMTVVAGYWDICSILMKGFKNLLLNITLWNLTINYCKNCIRILFCQIWNYQN